LEILKEGLILTDYHRLIIRVCLVRGFWRGGEERGDDFLNFYVWFNFLTRGGEGRR
jgi:hypothetical protein